LLCYTVILFIRIQNGERDTQKERKERHRGESEREQRERKER